ncbi:MAG: hypothetical protein V1773_07170, partial [bacterium]
MKLFRYLVMLIAFQFVVVCTITAQTTIEKEIEKIKTKSGIKILDLGNDRISVNYNNTGTRIFNFGDNNKNQTLYNDVPTFTFNL